MAGNMTTQLINILIRTTGKREESFNRCLQSVVNQTHKNVRIIVSYDCDTVPSYIPQCLTAEISGVHYDSQDLIDNTFQIVIDQNLIEIIKVRKQPSLYGYNLYCNDLKSQVTDGYLLYLDDDDTFVDNRSLERIVPHLREDKVIICQMIRGYRVKPRYGEIESGKIGMPCFLLHAKHKDVAMFDDSSNADYKFIAEICSKLPHKFVPIVVVRSDKRSYGA